MVNVKFYGHSAIRLTGEKNIVLDPGIVKGEILVPDKEETDIICVTHKHKDHFGNAAEMAKRHEAWIVGNKQTIAVAYRKRVPIKLLKYLQNGKTLTSNGAVITGYRLRHGFPFMRFMVDVMGFVLSMSGVSFAHLGDTVWCENLRRIKTNILFVPIGGIVTFNVKKAVEVVRMIKPDIVVPIHAETSISTTDFRLFERLIRKKTRGISVETMEIGETIEVGASMKKSSVGYRIRSQQS
ncbi:MAG: MBL fold metallo-hydrolase [Promethearchaeota archaeon]